MLRNPDEPAPRSHHHDRNVDPGRGTEWKTNVWMATKRAALKMGSWSPSRMVDRLADREPLRDSDYAYAVYLFLEEMNRLNQEGCPDDYEDTWGEACRVEFWSRIRAERVTERRAMRAVQAAGATA